MANTLTPEQFEQACKNAIVSVEKNISKILINTTNIGSADMQSRIFDEGKTVAGNTMRYRSKAYKKLRVDAGLGIAYKDLEFTGDLFFSMSILSTAQNEVAYGFNNNRTAEIAGYQEESRQVGEPIFELSDKEAKLMERQFAIDVAKVFKGALENFPNMPSTNTARDKAISRNVKKQQKRSKAKLNQTIKKKQTKLQKQQERFAKTKNVEYKERLSKTIERTRESLAKSQSRKVKKKPKRVRTTKNKRK
jgi:hypothetical protein